MASIHTVLEAIIDNGSTGQKVRVDVVDRAEYETVRTRLVKLWNTHKETLTAIMGAEDDPVLSLSLCGNYDPQEDAGFFYLGKPRRKMAKSYSFSIVEAGGDPAISSMPKDAPNDSTDSRASKLA